MTSVRKIIRPATLLVFVALPLLAVAAVPKEKPLHINVRVCNELIMAKLVNVSDNAVKVVGNSIAPISGYGGFHIEIRQDDGNPIKYCAMIDGKVPSPVWLQPNASITYTDTIRSISSQYCLKPGTYKGRIVYYNAVVPFGKKFTAPVKSSVFHFTVVRQRKSK